MVMVVADASLEPCRRSCRLDPPDQAFGVQNTQAVVHRLERDGADLFSDGCGHGVSRDVGLARDGPKNSQPLRGDLNAALFEDLSRVDGHPGMLDQIME
jgi:hypothetical protein